MNYGETLLTKAIYDGHIEIVRELIDKGAKVNENNQDKG